MLESCFYSSLPAEAVTVAILRYASFHSWCLMNRKVKSFKQTVFLSKQCAMLKVTTVVWSAVFWPRCRPTIVLSHICCPVDNTLFAVSPEIRCSGVSSRYCCYGNYAANLKTLIISTEHW